MKSKKNIIFLFYFISFILLMGCIYLIFLGINRYVDNTSDFLYSKDSIIENNQPVINIDNQSSTIIRPYVSDKVSIGKYYYDFESDSKKQENALIYYENTYMQNSGVDYVSEEAFDVISIYSGKVISIENNDLLGNIIKIEHENEIISVYQSLSEVLIKEGEVVNTGTIIAKSGTSKITENYKNCLHLEVYYKNQLIDPENIFTKNINDL